MKFIGQVVALQRKGRTNTAVTLCGIDGDQRTFEIEVLNPFADGYAIGRRVEVKTRTLRPTQRWE